MSNKKKLQKIMAEDDRMFQAMSSKQFGRSVALRSVEQPTQKTPPKKRRVRKEARGWSQFTVSPMGVFDALSSSLTASMFPIPQASDRVDTGKDDEQGEADESPVQKVSPKTSRGEEVPQASPDTHQLPEDSRVTEATSVESEDEHVNHEGHSTAEIFNQLDVVPGYTFHPRVDGPDIGDVIKQKSLGGENNLGPDGIRYDYRTDNLPENPFKEFSDDEIEDDEPEVNPLVQRRRDDAQKERAAAARNFAKQRQAPPIMGIPDPVPIQPIHFEGEAAGPNGDETLIAQDRAATQQLEFARSMVDITEKMAMELQAISIRLRTVELFLDRM